MPRKITHQIVHTYKQETASIGAGLIVVHGTADGQVKLPGSADVGSIVGITKHAGDATANTDIEVVVEGFADLVVLANSPNIVRGYPIAISGTTGKGYYKALANAMNYIGYATEDATADDVIVSVNISKFSTPAS